MKRINYKFLLVALLLLPTISWAVEGGVNLDNPLGAADVPSFVATVINAVLGIVGALSLLYFVLGGLTWLTSQGNQEKVKRGKETLTWATFGLAAIFFSYVVVRFVVQSLTK